MSNSQLVVWLITTTLLYATPLLLAAMGGLLSERSGVVNIGLEGLMVIGAFVSALVAYKTHSPWLGLGTAAIAGALFAVLHAVATITFHADQVVSGAALNLLGVGVATYVCKSIFGSPETPPMLDTDSFSEVAIPGLGSLPLIGPLFHAKPVVYVALVLVVALFFFLQRTVWGLRLRAVGENPHAVATAGISVVKTRYVAVMLSGFMAGLGGASLALAVSSGGFNGRTVLGQGFIALAALILGRWRPAGVLAATLFFALGGAIEVVAKATLLHEFIASEVLSMLPYLLTMLAMIVFGRMQPPKALGRHYALDKS